MSTTKPLSGSLLPSGVRCASRGIEYIQKMFQRFSIKSFCVLIDHTSQIQDMPSQNELSKYSFNGFFTFDLGIAERNVSKNIGLLTLDGPIPDCDAWLILSTLRAAPFSLAQALMQTGNENQIIVRYYAGQTTEMTAYMDMFSGETETLMYINHYFERKYRIIFPIDIRYTVCNTDGSIVKSGQRIIPPGGVTAFDSKKMNLGNFIGYLKVYVEVENLQVRVQPFIHFWADYISSAGMCRNHQSGWSPWPPETVFNRGYLPLDPNLEAIACFYNANDFEIKPKAFLHFVQKGIEKKHLRDLASIPAGHMSYQNISQVFNDVDLNDVNAAYILLICDKPLHRPNYYITVKGTLKFVDTFHQTGGKACYCALPSYKLTKNDLELLDKYNIEPWAYQLPILDKRFQIDTYLGLLSMTICDVSEFSFIIRDENWNKISSEDFRIDGTTPIFININEYIKNRGLDIQAGTFQMIPLKNSNELAFDGGIFFGLKHKLFPYFSTSFVGGSKDANFPFYLNAKHPFSREYDYSALQTTDKFSPGIISDEYDSLFIVTNRSLLKNYSKKVEYRLDIYDINGNQYSIFRNINPGFHDAFWLSEVLTQAGISSKGIYFTLWVKCYDAKLLPYHLLYRKKDHSLSFDDASDGTLQTDPQIAGINSSVSSDVFKKFLEETGVNRVLNSSIPNSLKQNINELNHINIV